MQVLLSNTTTASVTLSIPRDYRNYTTVALAPGECRVLGTFTRPSGARNIGFRDLTPTLLPIAAPRLVLAVSGMNNRRRPRHTQSFAPHCFSRKSRLPAGAGSVMLLLTSLVVTVKPAVVQLVVLKLLFCCSTKPVDG